MVNAHTVHTVFHLLLLIDILLVSSVFLASNFLPVAMSSIATLNIAPSLVLPKDRKYSNFQDFKGPLIVLQIANKISRLTKFFCKSLWFLLFLHRANVQYRRVSYLIKCERLLKILQLSFSLEVKICWRKAPCQQIGKSNCGTSPNTTKHSQTVRDGSSEA